MDRFNLGRIERRRFYECFDILYVLLEIRKRRNKIKHLRNTLMPKWKECISKIYNNNYYSAIIHLINIYSLLLMFWREVMEVYGVSNLEILPLWTSVATIVNIIYFIDMIFSFIEFGFWKSIVDIYTLIEVGCQILSTAAFLKILISADYFFSIKVYELIVLVRIIKLLKLLEEIEQWKIIVLTLRRLVSPFVTLFLVQMGIVYTYAVIGERIYGGEISMKIVRKLSDANFGREFLTMNFNGLLISISTLLYFSLAWPQTIKIFVIAVPGLITYTYTFSFFVFSNLCLWRIMVAVAIEVYVTIKRLYLENSSAELNVQKKMLEKENGSLLVQDLTTSRIIRKHEMLDLDNSNISHKRFNSPKIKSKRTLLSEEDFGYVARHSKL